MALSLQIYRNIVSNPSVSGDAKTMAFNSLAEEDQKIVRGETSTKPTSVAVMDPEQGSDEDEPQEAAAATVTGASEAQAAVALEKFDEPENEELRLQIFRLFDKGITDASVKTALGLTDELIAVARKAHAVDAQQMVDNALTRANESGKHAYDAEFEAKKQFVERLV